MNPFIVTVKCGMYENELVVQCESEDGVAERVRLMYGPGWTVTKIVAKTW